MFQGMRGLFRVQTAQSLREPGKMGQGTSARSVASSERKDSGGRVPLTVGESRYLRADIFERTRKWL